MSAALIAKLAAAGLAPDLLGEIAMALGKADAIMAAAEAEADDDEARKAERRAKNAERQRRHRASRNAMSRVTAVTNGDSALPKESVSPAPPSKENLPPPKENPPKGGQKKRASRLSEDWSLSDEGRAYALAQGVPSGKVDQVAARFKNYWLSKSGKDATKLDWAATWRNWVLSDCERNGWAPASTGPPEKPPDEDACRPPGAPSSAELRARYAAATKAADDLPAEAAENPAYGLLRPGEGVHRSGEADYGDGPLRGHKPRNGRMEQLGDLLPPNLRLVAGGHA